MIEKHQDQFKPVKFQLECIDPKMTPKVGEYLEMEVVRKDNVGSSTYYCVDDIFYVRRNALTAYAEEDVVSVSLYKHYEDRPDFKDEIMFIR